MSLYESSGLCTVKKKTSSPSNFSLMLHCSLFVLVCTAREHLLLQKWAAVLLLYGGGKDGAVTWDEAVIMLFFVNLALNVSFLLHPRLWVKSRTLFFTCGWGAECGFQPESICLLESLIYISCCMADRRKRGEEQCALWSSWGWSFC